MKYFDWAEDKNHFLKKERGISFEEIELAISKGEIIDTIPHPNQKEYPGQKIFFLFLKEYIWAVPFIEDDDKIFLKTAYKTRKGMQKYYQGEHK